MRANLETVEAWRSIASYCQRAAKTLASDSYDVTLELPVRALILGTARQLRAAAYDLDKAVALAGKPK